MRLRLLASAAILTGSLFGADPELVGLAMPDTQVMAGVNVEQVKLSPLGQFLLAQIPQNSEGGLQELTKTTGFDPRRDLREILVCTNGLPANGPTLLLARGAFDVPKILAAAVADGGKSETYKGVPIVIRAARGSLALPDSTLAIVGRRGRLARRDRPQDVSHSYRFRPGGAGEPVEHFRGCLVRLHGAAQPIARAGGSQQRRIGSESNGDVLQSAAGQRRREVRSQYGGESAGGLGDGPGCRDAGHRVEGDGHWIIGKFPGRPGSGRSPIEKS